MIQATINGGSVTERFGLRKFGVDAATSRLTINEEIIKLVGWNHHTQWPNTSASPTNEQMDADIALLTRGGANYVSFSDVFAIVQVDWGILCWYGVARPLLICLTNVHTLYYCPWKVRGAHYPQDPRWLDRLDEAGIVMFVVHSFAMVGCCSEGCFCM